MPRVSVIIPIYKVEKYLATCLDSVLAQTLTDWEAICVNDGSPDKCGEILAQYAKKDKRFKVITQKNQGVSVARNNALKQATGDYICFLDSDDMLHPEFLKILLENIKKYHVQEIGCEFQVFKDQCVHAHMPKCLTIRYYRHPLIRYLLRNMRYHAMVWGKLYHRSVFQNLHFEPAINYGEDSHISMQILSKVDSVVFISLPLYAYRESESSLTRSEFSVKMVDDHISSGIMLNEFFEKNNSSKFVRFLIRTKMANRAFRWACIRAYKKDKKNYQSIWERYIPIFNDLIQKKKFSPFDLSMRYWIPFYLWQHKYWNTLQLFGIGRR